MVYGVAAIVLFVLMAVALAMLSRSSSGSGKGSPDDCRHQMGHIPLKDQLVLGGYAVIWIVLIVLAIAALLWVVGRIADRGNR